jgi:hypothetical protein
MAAMKSFKRDMSRGGRMGWEKRKMERERRGRGDQ